jgi:hypothetical protein
MTNLDDTMLAQRFHALVYDVRDPSWEDVEHRAERVALPRVPGSETRRRRFVLAAAVAGTLVLAIPALGLPQRVAKLFEEGARAPMRTERLFSTLDRGAPAGLETHVIPGSARKALETVLPGAYEATLWLAPTRDGGYCELIEINDRRGNARGSAGPGCTGARAAPGFGMVVPGPVDRDGVVEGPLVIHGHTRERSAVSARILFEDGSNAVATLTWISEPIDAGFFVYGAPEAHWRKGALPTAAELLDAQGSVVGRWVALGLLQAMIERG